VATDRSRIAVLPGGTRAWLTDAVVAAGGEPSDPVSAAALVWAHPDDPAGLSAVLTEHPALQWVQLPWAGIEPYVDVVRTHADRTWTCGKGVYAEPVAEHALALALAGMRRLHQYARSTSWTSGEGENLLGARVVILGGGGITASLVRLLGPFGCDTTVVRRSASPMDGVDRVVGPDRIDDVELLAPNGWVVNVARGAHVVTEDLVEVLAAGRIGGAALDVTDPEPLPDDHPLWREPRCIVTPHTANTPEMAVPLLSARVTENTQRWIAGEELVGSVDAAAGY
jgi:phosphoglycerate dehydrogenase-like enzyme